MPERARPTRPAVDATAMTIDQLQAQLSIDPDALDDCLLEQPDFYYHVAEGYARAAGRRDMAKRELEEAVADLDAQFRRQAIEDEEKITEAALTRKLAAAPRIQTLERDLLRFRVDADRWLALKEAFQQRSFMLRELVQMQISRLAQVSMDRSVQSARDDLGEANRRALGERRFPRSK